MQTEFFARQILHPLKARLRLTRCYARMALIDFARYFGALILVLGLVGAAGIAARRFGGIVKTSASRRLAIVESILIAPRQRLLLVRHDGVEHLVLSSPDGASIVESRMAPAASAP